MDIEIIRLGDTKNGERHIETEYSNKDAWYATVNLGEHKIDVREVDGKLELNCPTGKLLVELNVALGTIPLTSRCTGLLNLRQ